MEEEKIIEGEGKEVHDHTLFLPDFDGDEDLSQSMPVFNVNSAASRKNDQKKGFLGAVCTTFSKVGDRVSEIAKGFYDTHGKNYTIAFSCLAFTIADSFLMVLRIAIFTATLNRAWLWCNFFYMLISCVIPFVGWLYATETDYFYYHNRKKFYFLLSLIHLGGVIVQPLMNFTAAFLFPYLQGIKITPVFSKVMVLWLARLSIPVLPVIFFLCIFPAVSDTWFSENLLDQLMTYRLYHTLDTRKNRQWLYDLTVCEDLETGEPAVEQENDRFIHKLVNGSSGSGKSSSDILPTIYSDLQKKARNDDHRQHELERLIREGKAFLHLPDNYNGEFKDEYVVPLDGYKSEYQEILNKYRTCGIILLAPDDETCLKAINLAKAYGYKPKVIDPSAFTDSDKVDLLDYLYGINPLYVPLGLSVQGECVYVPKVAQDLEMTLLQAEKSGGGTTDGFFENVNKHVTSMIAQVVILYYRRVRNRQATFDDFVTHLQNPSTLIDVMSDLEDLYGRCDQNHLKDDEVFKPNIRKNGDNYVEIEKNYDPHYREVAFRVHKERGSLGCTLEETSFQNTFNQIYTELINPGLNGSKSNKKAESIDQWAYGLRNVASNLVQRPELKRTLSYAKTVDFDQVMADGEIVICNFCLHLGRGLAAGFGLMVQLAINAAALRRPYSADIKPCPVFEICDESPVILGEWAEEAISLWRKYSCGITLAMQSNAQLEKNETTKYLKGIMQGVGTLMIFGRAGVEEMDIYNKLAGQTKETTEMLTVTESSILDDSPQMSYGTRYQEMDADQITQTSIRNRDFQEATIYTTRQGRVIEAHHVKLHFLPKDAYDPKERHGVDFSALAEEFPVTSDEETYLSKLMGAQAELEREAEQKRIAAIAEAYQEYEEGCEQIRNRAGDEPGTHGIVSIGPTGKANETVIEDPPKTPIVRAEEEQPKTIPPQAGGTDGNDPQVDVNDVFRSNF